MLNLTEDQLKSAFGDGSVILPEGWVRPAHWPAEDLDWHEFRDAWRAWQQSIGYVPPKSEA
ncbi:MAG TPA: hypothetical protein VFR34_00030 [Paracoccaceae bacterium]|nr:hypothetical protein [Paracoccaceae bacterium]